MPYVLIKIMKHPATFSHAINPLSWFPAFCSSGSVCAPFCAAIVTCLLPHYGNPVLGVFCRAGSAAQSVEGRCSSAKIRSKYA